MSALEGRYFYPNAARFVPARASVIPTRILHIEDEHGQVLDEVLGRQVKITARLASRARLFDLPDGGRFESDDNDGADSLIRALRRRRRGRFTDRLERAWPVVLASLIVTLLAGYYVFAQLIPLGAEWLARETLPAVGHTMSEQTLRVLDHTALTATKLKAADQFRATKLFMKTAVHSPGGIGAYRLVFRAGRKGLGGSDAFGPNAFALPDGTIVMTDSLWTAVKHDAEIQGVFAHEMSHVDHAHGLQLVYEAALLPAALAIFTGDVSQVSQMAALLPTIILQSSYSRGMEQEADDDGAAVLRALHEKPSHMADLLERLDKQVCGKNGCPRNWVGDHPETAARAARLRLEDLGPIQTRLDCAHPWRTGISLRCLGITSH
ncbi:MAG TPA: M48 family metallopeptidase [Rhizomicrobium sp.]